MEGSTTCGKVKIEQNWLILAVAVVLSSDKQPQGGGILALHKSPKRQFGDSSSPFYNAASTLAQRESPKTAVWGIH